MQFLAALLAQLLERILSMIGSAAIAAWKRVARRKEIAKQADESVQPLREAKTGEEIDRASDSALDGF